MLHIQILYLTFNESFGRIINSHVKQKQINQSKYKKILNSHILQMKECTIRMY